MLRAYKYRLYPSVDQEKLIDQHFSACRLIYNLALQTKIYAYQTLRITLNCYDLQKQLPDLKKDNLWMYNVNAQSLQSVLHILDNAYTNFFKHGASFPKFKNKRKSVPSCHFPQGSVFKIDTKRIKLKKFPEGIKISVSRIPVGTLRNVIITKSKTNKYYASLTYETGVAFPNKKLIIPVSTVGVDLGLMHFTTLSNGRKIDNPRYLQKALIRIKVLQQRHERKVKGSNRRKMHQLKINRLYEKVTNKRNDFLHKLSTEITNQFGTVCIETLSISNMVKNHSLAVAIHDASWYKFTKMLEYKCAWNGSNLLRIGRFEPSSRLCTCGVLNNDLKLSDREWTCANCGMLHDRDILAADNIKNIALHNYEKNASAKPDLKRKKNIKKLSGEVIAVEDVELLTLVGTKKRQLKLEAN